MSNKTAEREALARRNRILAEAMHATPLKHRLRRGLLRAAAALPPLPNQIYQPDGSERILLIRPDYMGDVLLTTPALLALRAALPQAELHALVGPWSAEVIASYPQIDLTLTVPFPAFSRAPKQNWRSPYELVLSTARQLRIIGYSAAVIFRPDHWWGALLAKLAGIPLRIGYALPDVAPFLTDALNPEPQHALLQNLKLVERWTGTIAPAAAVYDFPLDDDDRGYINGYLEEWDIRREQRLLVIHAGSGAALKNWPDERWAAVADTLAGQLESPVVLTGSDHELATARNIAGRMKERAIVMAGDTRVGQLAALFARARVVLGPDSGPLHLAAAVGTPTVALFGPADPAEFGTWGSPPKHFILTSSIACRPCRLMNWQNDALENHPCVRDITVGQVLEAARRAAHWDKG
ncbi:MAG: glycosyltransferase family 9 protein [Chloroflexi bacterium]|nr:glycosyltransferase family 9 protein [Chloroflexota bacterium]